jgi:hypothetical protein
MRARFALLACALLSACGGLSDSDVEEALEQQWASDPRAMADAFEITIPGMEKGAARGAAQALQSLSEAAKDYGYAGEVVADAAGGVMSEGGKIAGEFGIEGAEEFTEAVGLINATDWTVSNLEIISKRSSGDDHLAKVRYDLSAKVDGKMQTLQQDISHSVRLADVDGTLAIILPQAQPAE